MELFLCLYVYAFVSYLMCSVWLACTHTQTGRNKIHVHVAWVWQSSSSSEVRWHRVCVMTLCVCTCVRWGSLRCWSGAAVSSRSQTVHHPSSPCLHASLALADVFYVRTLQSHKGLICWLPDFFYLLFSPLSLPPTLFLFYVFHFFYSYANFSVTGLLPKVQYSDPTPPRELQALSSDSRGWEQRSGVWWLPPETH